MKKAQRILLLALLARIAFHGAFASLLMEAS